MTNNKVDWHERRNVLYNDEEQKNIVTKNLETAQMILSSEIGVNLLASILRLYYFCTHEQLLPFCILCLLRLIFDSKGTFENNVVKIANKFIFTKNLGPCFSSKGLQFK